MFCVLSALTRFQETVRGTKKSISEHFEYGYSDFSTEHHKVTEPLALPTSGLNAKDFTEV